MSYPQDPSRQPYGQHPGDWQAPYQQPPQPAQTPYAGQPGAYNPYAAPTTTGMTRLPLRTGLFPTICTVMFILDLIFCALHVPLAFVNLAQMDDLKSFLPPGHRWFTAVKVDVGLRLAIAATGVLGAALLLAKNRLGLIFGGLAVALAAAFIIFTIWVAFDVVNELPDNGHPEAQAIKSGVKAGAFIGVLLRIVLNTLYVVALVKFAGWWNQRQRGPSAYAAYGGYGGQPRY
jgi:hypothetical protein